jgi:hypothetical protein
MQISISSPRAAQICSLSNWYRGLGDIASAVVWCSRRLAGPQVSPVVLVRHQALQRGQRIPGQQPWRHVDLDVEAPEFRAPVRVFDRGEHLGVPHGR